MYNKERIKGYGEYMIRVTKSRIYGILLFLLLVLIVIGCTNRVPTSRHISFSDTENVPQIRNSKKTQQQPLRIAISTVLSPVDTISYYRGIANYLGEKMGRPVILLQRKSYAEIALLLVNGGADMAFLSTGAYAIYSNVEGTEPLVVQQRMGVPYYQSYIITAKESPITNLMDLKGTTMAFTDPLSYSGYLYFESQLREKGETPEHFLRQFIYTYSHEKSLRAVSTKVVDVASIDSLIYEYAKVKNPDLVNRVKIIAVSPPVGTGPVVIGHTIDLEQRQQLREIFLHMHENVTLQPILQGLLIDRFVPFEPELYENMRNILQEKRREL